MNILDISPEYCTFACRICHQIDILVSISYEKNDSYINVHFSTGEFCQTK